MLDHRFGDRRSRKHRAGADVDQTGLGLHLKIAHDQSVIDPVKQLSAGRQALFRGRHRQGRDEKQDVIAVVALLDSGAAIQFILVDLVKAHHQERRRLIPVEFPFSFVKKSPEMAERRFNRKAVIFFLIHKFSGSDSFHKKSIKPSVPSVVTGEKLWKNGGVLIGAQCGKTCSR